MSGGDRVQEELARYLRQREEMGAGDLFLQGLDRSELLNLATASRDAGQSHPAASPQPEEAPTAIPHRTEDTPLSGEALAGMGYDELRDTALRCGRCTLKEGRTQVVFSDGNPKGRVVVVGEAPGANEDRMGLAFVGQAGKLLDLLLASVGLSRAESVYICNVLKCRPPGNRDPLLPEIEACTPFLKQQLELVAPEVILGVGTFAAQFLLGRTMPLGKMRGELHSYGGIPLVVTYHPAALLRNSGWTRATWDDFQLLRQVLDGG